jgi:chorismate dehydratase
VAKPRLAASGYLNSTPLVWSFTQGTRRNDVDYVDAVPARCADLLAAGSADFALVPVIEYQRIDSARLVPNVCVAARETVRSVVLATKCSELKDVRSVALDESSRTSAALVKIIFREFLGVEPQWTSSSPNLRLMLEQNDAALIIGDPAMTFERQGLKVFDLASLWRHYTGHGFVFAMWMVGANVSEASGIDFDAACVEGVTERPAIIDSYQPLLGLSREELHTYLYENICYFMDSDLRAGLELYYKLAHKHGLIPALKPLNL